MKSKDFLAWAALAGVLIACFTALAISQHQTRNLIQDVHHDAFVECMDINRVKLVETAALTAAINRARTAEPSRAAEASIAELERELTLIGAQKDCARTVDP